MEWKDFDKGVFLVNCLGIIYNPKTKKVLIGRRENDPYIKKLTWCFPGGRPEYGEELDDSLVRAIKEKTNLKIKNPKIIFAKTYPEKKEFMAIYFICNTFKGNIKASNGLVELKWVDAKDLEKYFTTSFHPKLKKYLLELTKNDR